MQTFNDFYIEQLRDLILEIDLTDVKGSLAYQLKEKTKIFDNPNSTAEQVKEAIISALDESNVSTQMKKKVLYAISKIEENKMKLMQYAYNLILSGAGHKVLKPGSK